MLMQFHIPVCQDKKVRPSVEYSRNHTSPINPRPNTYLVIIHPGLHQSPFMQPTSADNRKSETNSGYSKNSKEIEKEIGFHQCFKKSLGHHGNNPSAGCQDIRLFFLPNNLPGSQHPQSQPQPPHPPQPACYVT